MTLFDYMSVKAKNVKGSGKTTVSIYLENGFYNSIPKQTSAGYFNGNLQFIASANGTSATATGQYDDGDTINLTLNTDATSVTITVKGEYTTMPAPVSAEQSQTQPDEQ